MKVLKMNLHPISLQNQCLIYIISFLELFPLDYLALLPAAIRQQLLENLPPADICRLEQSSFIEGLDMERIWGMQKQTTMYIRKTDWLYDRSPTNFKDSFFRRVYTIVFQAYDSRRSTFILIGCLCTPGHQGMQYRRNSGYRNRIYRQTKYWSYLHGNRNCLITTPHRFQQYYDPNPYERFDLITLTPELCHYYPKALRVPLRSCTTAVCGSIIRDTTLSTTMFQHVKNLHFTLTEQKTLLRYALVSACARRVAHYGHQETQQVDLTTYFSERIYTIFEAFLYPALQVLEELTIEVDTTKTLGVMLEMSVPLLRGTTLSQISTSNIMTMTAQNIKNFTIILGRPLSVTTPVPLSIAHDTLLQYLSSLFSLPHFKSLHLEGIIFQDDPHAHAFGSILYTFLTSPTTHEQSLTCRSIRFEQLQSEDYKTMPLPPPVVSSEHSLKYKSLQFEGTSLPQSILTWLFQTSQLHLQALKLHIQPLRVSTRPLVMLPAGIENVHVQRLALHTCKHPLKRPGGRHQRPNPFTQLKSAAQCKVDPDFYKTVHSLQQILLKNALMSLDLESNNLGHSGILPYLTEGLINRATTGTLRELNLANNYLEDETDQNLANLFDAIFCLPQIQELSLNINGNGLNRHHFDIIHTSWTKKSAGLKLQFLNYNFRVHVLPHRYAKQGDDAKYVHEIMAMIASHTPPNQELDEQDSYTIMEKLMNY